MKKLIIIIILILLPSFAFAGMQDAHKAVIARMNVAGGGGENETWGEWTDTYYGDSFDANFRVPLDDSTFNINGTSIIICIQGNDTSGTTITSSYVGEKASSGDSFDMEPGTITEITWDTGTTGASIAAGEIECSDEVNYAYNKNKHYLISFGVSDHHVQWLATADGVYWLFGGSASAGTADVTSLLSNAAMFSLYSVEIKN